MNRFTRSDCVIIRNKFLVFQELPQLALSWKSPRKNSPKSSEAATRPCGCILEFSLLCLPTLQLGTVSANTNKPSNINSKILATFRQLLLGEQ